MSRLSGAILSVIAAIAFAAATLAAQGTAATQTPPQTPTPTPAAASTPAPKSAIVQRIVVKVNGEIFTQSELEFGGFRHFGSEPAREARRRSEVGSRIAGGAGGNHAGHPGRAVDELLVVQHGREMGMKFTESIFSKSLEDLKKSNNLDDRRFRRP
jgi:hypothetical protein